MAKHKVESIVSMEELLQQLGGGLSKEEYAKFAVQAKKMIGESAVEQNSNASVSQTKALETENKLTPKQQAKEDERFNRIRQKLIEEVFGVSAKDQANLMAQGERASETLANNARSGYEAVKDKENILGAAETADKNAKRELLAGSLDVALAIGGLASEQIAGLVATITGVSVAFPVIGAALTTFVFGVKLAKYIKSSKQSKSDVASKKEDFLKDVAELTQKIKTFSGLLESKKAEILAESKNCKSKEEYNNFIKNKAQELSGLIQEKGAELGVSGSDMAGLGDIEGNEFGTDNGEYGNESNENNQGSNEHPQRQGGNADRKTEEERRKEHPESRIDEGGMER